MIWLIVLLVLSLAGSNFYQYWTYMGDHWMEAKLKPSDQKAMALECAEIVPSDARELRLDYSNMDAMVDVIHYRTKQPLAAILKEAELTWEITEQTKNHAALEYVGPSDSVHRHPHAAIWQTPKGVVLCLSFYYEPLNDTWIREKIQRHSPFPIP